MKRILRISRARFDLEKAAEVGEVLKAAQATIWPKQTKLPGYIDGYVGLDRRSGAMVWATFWESVEQGETLGRLPEMVASNEQFRAAGMNFEPITSYELL